MKYSEDLDRFFEFSLDPLCIADTKGKFLRVNPEFGRLLGYTAEELTSRAYLDFVHADDIAATEKEAAKLAAGQPVLSFENRYRHKDGSWRRLSWRVSPPDEKGLLYCVVRNVTDEWTRREATRLAQKRVLRFQQILLRLRDDDRDGLEGFLRLVTRECAKALETERVSVWFFSNEGETIQCHDLYRRTPGVHESGLRFSRSEHPSYFKTISGHDALMVKDARTDAATREFDEAYLNPNGIVSKLDVPIRAGSKLVGVLCCEQVAAPRKWDVQEEKFVASVAAYVMLAVERAERRRNEEEVRKLNETLEQRIAERTSQLIANERRFGLVIEQVQDYEIIVLDTQGRVATWNTGSQQTKGYADDEIIGRHYSCFYTEEDRAAGKPEQLLREAAHKGNVVDEGWRVRKDGTRFWAQVVITAIHDETGRLIEFGKVTHDLTERKRAENVVRESEEQFRLAMENSAIGMALVAPDGRFLKVNASLCSILGYSETQLLALDFQAITHPDDLGEDLEKVGLLLAGEIATYQMEKRYFHSGGEEVWVLLTVSLVRDEDEGPRYFISQIQDISGRKLAEEMQCEAFERQKELARSAQAGERAKSEFLAMMSHEVRTPMNGVLGFAQLLANLPDLPEEGRNYADTIVSSGTTLLRILDDILDLSRLEAGAVEIEAAPFSPAGLLRDIRTLLTPAALAKQIDIRLEIDDGAKGVFLGDAGRLRQIVLNLGGNAIKFTERGNVTLGIRVSGREVEFFVQDTGCGIDAEGLEQLFEPFVQGDSSSSRRYGGAGLGLSISRRLAKLMGGSLTATSPPGGGSQFVARVSLQSVTAGLPEVVVPVAERTFDKDFANEHPLSILVVEDDPVNLRLILTMLRKLGYEPIFARDGVEAVEIYRQVRPACILMDVQMPRMDGIEATFEIRAMETVEEAPPVFILALTANTLEADRKRCMDAGMDSFLNKPLRYGQLAEVLKTAAAHAAAWVRVCH